MNTLLSPNSHCFGTLQVARSCNGAGLLVSISKNLDEGIQAFQKTVP
jgi:hypothetical protein